MLSQIGSLPVPVQATAFEGMQPLIFYDFKREITPENGLSISPSTWRSRVALNIKGIPYKTIWLHLSELESVLSTVPGLTRMPGVVPYTVPVLVDPNTQVSLMDSRAINRYLDERFPETHRLFPKGTAGLQASFVQSFTPRLVGETLIPLLICKIVGQQSHAAQEYLRRTRRELLGLEIEQIQVTGEAEEAKLRDLERLLGDMGAWIDANGPGAMFLGGEMPNNADLDVHAGLRLCVRVDQDGTAGQIVLSTGGGRWKKYLEAFDKWTAEH